MKFCPDWIVGFVDGEGSFTIAIIKNNRLKVGKQVACLFAVGQSMPNEWILEEIKGFFQCGRIADNSQTNAKDGFKRKPAYQYHVWRINDIISKIIPFFDEHPPILKIEEYKQWRRAAEMIWRKEHLTREGLAKLEQMKTELH